MKRDSRLSSVLHALLHMAEHDRPMTSEALAQCMNTNPVVVRRTMGLLREVGIVASARGHAGGWTITADLAEISLRQLHEVLGEPAIFAIGNHSEVPECLVEQSVNAALDGAFAEAEALLLVHFARVSIADIAADFARRHKSISTDLTPDMRHDVIVIGGSYAGMAAALQLLRARRSVLVIDAGQRRNRFTSHSHGFLGQDGVDPATIAAKAREQLLAYPTLSWIDGQANNVSGEKDAFAVEVENGGRHKGRRLLFATGVADTLPAIDGMAERWGKSIFHCPYCHGYELGQGRIGVIGTSPMSVHQAQLIPEWGAVTFFTNDAVPLDDAMRVDLAARKVTIEETPVAGIESHADVRLADGRVLSFAGLFTATQTHPASSAAADLGAELEPTPFGSQIKTDESKETTVPGAFACGDAARIPHSVTLAVGDGAWAGAQLHRSLVF